MASSTAARRSESLTRSAMVLPVLPCSSAQAGKAFGIDGDETGDELLAVANHHRLADEAMGADPILDHGRCHVLARRGDEDLLLAAGDAQESGAIQLADVAGMEPARPD